MTRAVLLLAVFLSTAASLGVELAIVRLGAPYVGQSLLPWSAAIASVLLGLTAGHVLGGIGAGRASNMTQVTLCLSAVWIGAGAAAGVMPGALQVVVEAFSDQHGFGAAAAVAISALAFPPSLAAGFVAPLAVRAATLMPKTQLPRAVGAIYAASAAGSVLGTVVAGFVLLERVGATGLTSIVATLWITLGIGMLLWRGVAAKPVAGVTAIAVVVAAILAVVVMTVPGPCLHESRYTCIRLHDRVLADGNLLRFMMLDEGVHSASDRDHPHRLHLGYAALSDRLAQTAFAQAAVPRALIVGGGGATLPRAWAAAPRNAEVLSIELDPMVAAVANDRMWAGRQARLTTVIGDGRAVVRALPPGSNFDVILMDAYRTRSVPPHLVTREFGQLIAARLTPRGVFLSNVIDRPDTPLLALSIARTQSKIFPVVDIWTADGVAEGMTNYIVAAWKDGSSAHRSDREIVTVSVMNAGEAVQSQDVVWRRIEIKAADRQWPGTCGIVLTDDRAPVDRLLAGRAARCRRDRVSAAEHAAPANGGL